MIAPVPYIPADVRPPMPIPPAPAPAAGAAAAPPPRPKKSEIHSTTFSGRFVRSKPSGRSLSRNPGPSPVMPVQSPTFDNPEITFSGESMPPPPFSFCPTAPRAAASAAAPPPKANVLPSIPNPPPPPLDGEREGTVEVAGCPGPDGARKPPPVVGT